MSKAQGFAQIAFKHAANRPRSEKRPKNVEIGQMTKVPRKLAEIDPTTALPQIL